MPNSMLKIAIKLYSGPSGESPGKKTTSMSAFITDVVIPALTPYNKKTMTIAISQNWYFRYGAYGAGNFRGDRLKTIDSAEKRAIIVRVFVFIFCCLPVLGTAANYLRVATKKCVERR